MPTEDELRPDAFPPYVTTNLRETVEWNPGCDIPFEIRRGSRWSVSIGDKLASDTDPERRATWLSRSLVTSGLYKPIAVSYTHLTLPTTLTV